MNDKVMLKCKEDVYADDGAILYTKDNLYEFTPVNNRFTKIYGFVGHSKDDEKYKRWMSPKFKEEYFEEPQLELCKKCVASELMEFTDNTKNYYFCHQANTRIDNIKFDKECQCFEEE